MYLKYYHQYQIIYHLKYHGFTFTSLIIDISLRLFALWMILSAGEDAIQQQHPVVVVVVIVVVVVDHNTDVLLDNV